jgi:hypothetical protein
MPGAAAGLPADDAETDPGLPRPGTVRDAATLPDQAAASTEPDPPAAGDGTTGDATAGDSSAEPGPAESAPAEPGPPARESRRARSKRAAADLPAEPDAADEWISLLTADPAEE